MVPRLASPRLLTHLALTWIVASATTARAAALTPAEASREFHQNIQPMLEEYCYDCHGDGRQKAGVAFDDLGSDQEILANSKLWFAALKNVRAGLMPPDENDNPRPSPAEVQRLANWIKYDAFGIDPDNPDPGRITIRRLNRVEYGNTIRDLMGVEFNAEAAFPPDDSGRGFDNLGDVLSVSPLLLEKYLQAADTIVRKAVPTVSRVIDSRVATGRDFKRKDGTGDGSSLNAARAATAAYTFSVGQKENYRLIVDLQVAGSFDFSPDHCRLIGRVDGRELLQEDITWHERLPLHYEFPQKWSAGPHEVSFEIQPLDPVIAPSTPAVAPAKTPIAQASATPAATAAPRVRAKKSAAKLPNLTVRIGTVRLDGPLAERYWVAPANYARFFPKGPAPAAAEARAAYARDILRAFASRAFRRPVEEAQVEQLARVARAIYEQPGKTFEEGIGRAMLAVLASPRFLFLIEQPQPTQPGETFSLVDEYSLASRLSYFLWASMPDQELIDLAGRGELRQQLPAQIDRMLKDRRSQGLVKNFVGQWLQARDIETVPINARAVLGITRGAANVSTEVDFDGPIRKAMRRETEMYFDYVMREDRSLLEFIDSDYTFLNELLAQQYDIPGITGTELHRVTLPPDSPRGGLLTQGTVLAVTSNPTRTSPVKRGLFVLDNFLGTPPPPPPPNIPALESAKKDFHDHDPSLREMLTVHRANPLCASCHARMDPLGLALENFNAMGMWRETDASQPIDAAGQLITGENFKNIRDLKRILTHERQADFYRCMTEKLLTYALGRGLDYYDVHTVDQIVEQLTQQNGRFSVLLAGVINSAPFQKQRNEDNSSAPVASAAAVP